jgi:uncharacterized protein DUF5906
LLVQQVRKVVACLREHRISARRSAVCRFRFNLPTGSAQHVAEIERWRCIGGIAFHQDAVEALSFGNVSGLLCRLRLFKQSIGILLRRPDRQHKLTALIGSPLGLFDFEVVRSGGMEAQVGEVGFRHGKGPENSERDLQRIWDRSGTASSEAVNDFIARLNRDHAVVLMGGQVLIMCEQHDQPQFMSPENFHLWLANDKVEIEDNKVLKKVPVSRAWIAHPERRQYSSVVFDPLDTNPEHYNLWRGFSVQPDANKSCEKFLAHIRDNICSDNREHFLWVMGFLAHMVQKPEEKPGVSLVLRGPEGVGKGFFANWIGKLCLHHFVVISQASHLTGRFNAHFLRALLAFVDEAFWAGDKSGEGALKHLVTDEYVTIEGKHKDPITVRNLSRLIIASNEKWVVPAGTQARRWGVLDVAPTYANNRAYFNAIDEELRSGGLAGLMHHLQTFDLGAVDVHTPPKTAALMEQKEESFAPHVQWWAEALKRGALRYESEESASDRLDFNRREKVTETDGWPTDILKENLWLAYKLYLREHNIRSRVMPDSQLHKWFGDNNLLPGARDWRPRGGARKRQLQLPSLEICRAAFSAHVGQTQQWGADDYGEEAA